MSISLYDEQKIKEELEGKTCPVHGEHPVVSIKSEGFSYAACCEEFGNALKTDLAELLKTDIRDSITQHLNKILR